MVSTGTPCGPVLVILGLIWDKKDLERKRHGKALKGLVLVSRWQFNRFKQSNGIGFRTEAPSSWQEKCFDGTGTGGVSISVPEKSAATSF